MGQSDLSKLHDDLHTEKITKEAYAEAEAAVYRSAGKSKQYNN